MSKGRRAVSITDFLPFLERTGQLHLLNQANATPERQNLPSEAASGVPTADKPSKAGKKRGQMNGTEREFSMILERQKQAGEIALWMYEAVTLRWGGVDVLRYTPDFLIIKSFKERNLEMKFIEVKNSFIRPIDLRRFKEARNNFPMFTFELHQKTKDAGWTQIY